MKTLAQQLATVNGLCVITEGGATDVPPRWLAVSKGLKTTMAWTPEHLDRHTGRLSIYLSLMEGKGEKTDCRGWVRGWMFSASLCRQALAQLEYQHRDRMDFLSQDLLTLSTSFDTDFQFWDGSLVGLVGMVWTDNVLTCSLQASSLLTVIGPAIGRDNFCQKNPREASF